MRWAIFNSDSANYTEAESLEAGFCSRAEAEAALVARYPDDDEAEIHRIEEDEDED